MASDSSVKIILALSLGSVRAAIGVVWELRAPYRTLLTLPFVFPSTMSATDMAVHGNRLAEVTAADAGFVVCKSLT